LKILVLAGSRNHQGKTAEAAEAVCKGVKKAGGETETIFLTEKKLERCRQCNSEGWGICQTEHRCIIEDDFAAIVGKIKAADVMVFASPVYFRDLSESMRGFLDRLRRIRFMNVPPPTPGHPANSANTPAIGLCYAGKSGFGTIGALANLEEMLQGCGFDMVDMIAVRRQNLEVKLPMLELTGQWLATKPVSGPMPPL
jgi:NAD(P)H-dependent FMN reductase